MKTVLAILIAVLLLPAKAWTETEQLPLYEVSSEPYSPKNVTVETSWIYSHIYSVGIDLKPTRDSLYLVHGYFQNGFHHRITPMANDADEYLCEFPEEAIGRVSAWVAIIQAPNLVEAHYLSVRLHPSRFYRPYLLPVAEGIKTPPPQQ